MFKFVLNTFFYFFVYWYQFKIKRCGIGLKCRFTTFFYCVIHIYIRNGIFKLF